MSVSTKRAQNAARLGAAESIQGVARGRAHAFYTKTKETHANIQGSDGNVSRVMQCLRVAFNAYDSNLKSLCFHL